MSTMYFAQFADVDGIIRMIRPKISALLNNSINGITVDIKKYQRNRTNEQNRYLWAIYKHIAQYHIDNPKFKIDDLPVRFVNSKFLHEYLKARFDIEETKKLTTVEFCQYTDNIQLLMTEQTKGNYDPIYPEEPFQTMD